MSVFCWWSIDVTLGKTDREQSDVVLIVKRHVGSTLCYTVHTDDICPEINKNLASFWETHDILTSLFVVGLFLTQKKPKWPLAQEHN